MRVCYITNELFHWGKYGGFGFVTRSIGRELAKKGIEVFVIMPQSSKYQKEIETLDGMTVLSVPLNKPFIIHSRDLIKLCDADIFHSEQPSVGTLIAQYTRSEKKHIITFQDPRNQQEYTHLYPFDHPNLSSLARTRGIILLSYKIYHLQTTLAFQKADSLFCQAKSTIPKVMDLYNLRKPPSFLPNFVEIPTNNIKKASEPTVCFLGRFDLIKRPEIFFKLAKFFPDVRFIAMGRAYDNYRDIYLKKRYGNIPNLTFAGLVTGYEKSKILSKSWILINTSLYECQPCSFLEGAAHKCAIMSAETQDHFSKLFGYYVENGFNNYKIGLKTLIDHDSWIHKGNEGYKYVKKYHEKNIVINRHINIYKNLTEN